MNVMIAKLGNAQQSQQQPPTTSAQRPPGNGYQQNVQNNQPGQAANSAPPFLCYDCGAPGHFARFCPQRQNLMSPPNMERQPSRMRATYQQPRPGGRFIKQQRGFHLGQRLHAASANVQETEEVEDKLDSKNVYLPLKIAGKNQAALLDTGCEITTIPAKLVRKRQLQPTTKTCLLYTSPSPRDS